MIVLISLLSISLIFTLTNICQPICSVKSHIMLLILIIVTFNYATYNHLKSNNRKGFSAASKTIKGFLESKFNLNLR